jgi:hypothetical protein
MCLSAYFIKKKAVTYRHAKEHLAQAQKKKKKKNKTRAVSMDHKQAVKARA